MNPSHEVAVGHMKMAAFDHDDLVEMMGAGCDRAAELKVRLEFDMGMAYVHALLFVGEQLELLAQGRRR